MRGTPLFRIIYAGKTHKYGTIVSPSGGNTEFLSEDTNNGTRSKVLHISQESLRVGRELYMTDDYRYMIIDLQSHFLRRYFI